MHLMRLSRDLVEKHDDIYLRIAERMADINKI
jgi:hypothetical protein